MFNYQEESSKSSNYLANQMDVNLNYGIHLHTSFEFIYVKKGALQIQIEAEKYIINEGYAALILPNQLHAYHTFEYSESYLCVFSVNYIYDFYRKTINKTATEPIFKFDETEIIDCFYRTNINEYLLKSAFYKIAYLFDKNTEYVTADQSIRPVIMEIISFVEKNFTNNINMKDLAHNLSYSYTYLSKLLNENLHMNFMSLVNSQRIDHAAHLIKNTEMNFTEIAMNCGYSSIRSFNRNFRKYIGKSPRAYRSE